ncbi:MAG: holo-ACP synthase [bacterium]|nr:holo-ACP synthase [bacterium]
MIRGTGIDLVTVETFEELCRNALFVEKHFTPAERLYAEKAAGPASLRLAARYAAKESFIKALGEMHLFRPRRLKSVDYKEIEVAHDPEGRPYLLFHGAFRKIVEELKITSHLSLSHDGGYAVAQVLLT